MDACDWKRSLWYGKPINMCSLFAVASETDQPETVSLLNESAVLMMLLTVAQSIQNPYFYVCSQQPKPKTKYAVGKCDKMNPCTKIKDISKKIVSFLQLNI
jgi:hypothetical protein